MVGITIMTLNMYLIAHPQSNLAKWPPPFYRGRNEGPKSLRGFLEVWRLVRAAQIYARVYGTPGPIQTDLTLSHTVCLEIQATSRAKQPGV